MRVGEPARYPHGKRGGRKVPESVEAGRAGPMMSVIQ